VSPTLQVILGDVLKSLQSIAQFMHKVFQTTSSTRTTANSTSRLQIHSTSLLWQGLNLHKGSSKSCPSNGFQDTSTRIPQGVFSTVPPNASRSAQRSTPICPLSRSYSLVHPSKFIVKYFNVEIFYYSPLDPSISFIVHCPLMLIHYYS